MVALDPKSVFQPLTGSPARVIHSLSYEVGGPRLKSPLLPNQATAYAALARNHKDAVTDLVVLESPFRCIVAADRSGSIRVWE